MNTSISYEDVLAIAKIIARCDYRVTVSRYVTSDNAPWIITVGESKWRKHLVIEEVLANRDAAIKADAMLAILADEESDKFGYDIQATNIKQRIKLSELTCDHYISVKKALYPRKVTATLRDLKSKFIGKRLRISDSKESLFDDESSEGVCKEVFQAAGGSDNFCIQMEMDKAFMGQKNCTIGFVPETVTETYVEGPLRAAKGGYRKIEVIG